MQPEQAVITPSKGSLKPKEIPLQWLTGSLVTEEGKAAFAEREARINGMIIPVHEIVKEKPIFAADLYSRFDPYQQNDVREAMWRLFDMGFIEMMENRMLRSR